MLFPTRLKVDEEQVLCSLGIAVPEQADEATLLALHQAAEMVSTAAVPRWIWCSFWLFQSTPLQQQLLDDAGEDIEQHLQGCDEVALLGLTLGRGVDDLLREKQAADMAQAVLLDAAASQLVEQYADAAENLLRKRAAEAGRFLTGRYSPGYGSMPLFTQGLLLRLLDAPRRIGLTCTAESILLPRKSITAVLGLADHAVNGKQADCTSCGLRKSCDTVICRKSQNKGAHN